MRLTIKELTKRSKKELLERVRDVVALKLDQMIRVDQKYTGKEIAQNLGLDAARISEILSVTPKPLSEQTLRKLIGGGVVNVQDILNKVNPTAEEREYLSKFRAYEEPRLVKEVEEISLLGMDPATLLGKLRRLAKKGVDINATLDGLLKG